MVNYLVAMIIMLTFSVVSVIFHDRKLTYTIVTLAFVPVLNMVAIFCVMVMVVIAITKEIQDQK